MRVHRLLSLPVVFLLFSRANAFFIHGELRCIFSPTKGVLYLEQFYLNKKLMGQYNSTQGNYTGFTNQTKEIAEELNKSQKFKEEEIKNLERCKNGVVMVDYVLSKAVEPTVKLRLMEVTGSQHSNMLICSAYDFFPKHVRLSWLRDGNETTSGVTSTEELSSRNWLYQIHSHLEFTPTPGEKISCKVEHASLMEPKLYNWEPVRASERNKFAIGTAGLLLGLLFFITGLIFYMKNSPGRTLVPTA